METGKRREATLNPAVKAASAPVPLAATAMAGKPRAIRHAEAPASAAEQRMAEEDLTAAGIINRSVVRFRVV